MSENTVEWDELSTNYTHYILLIKTATGAIAQPDHKTYIFSRRESLSFDRE